LYSLHSPVDFVIMVIAMKSLILISCLVEQAKRSGKYFPRGLSHSMIFYTAGYAVSRVIPNHVPYAEKFGVWERGWGSFKDALDKTWKPYLEGHGTRDEAFAAVIMRTDVSPPKP
jgi:hypothetical protein